MYKNIGRITKEFILSRVSQEEIFHRYLGLYPEFFTKFQNPKRKDNTAGCTFYEKNGIIYFTDKAWGKHWDCFNVVEYEYGIDFKQAMKKIAKDFGLANIEEEYVSINRRVHIPVKQKKRINIKRRNWNKLDVLYWNKFGIAFREENGEYESEVLNFFRVCPVQYFLLNGFMSYKYKETDPCYAYYFKDGDYKLYFPLRNKGTTRFITNTNKVQGLEQLDKFGDYLVITKSYKDVIALFNFEIPAIAPQSEGVLINKELFIDLYNRFDNIFSLYDFDITGITTANKLRKLYGIEPLFFTNGRFYSKNYEAKDFTDYIDLKGKKEALNLINKIKYDRDI